MIVFILIDIYIYVLFSFPAVPPRIILKADLLDQQNTQLIRVAKGDQNVQLKCQAVGDTPITVKWTKVSTVYIILICTKTCLILPFLF